MYIDFCRSMTFLQYDTENIMMFPSSQIMYIFLVSNCDYVVFLCANALLGYAHLKTCNNCVNYVE